MTQRHISGYTTQGAPIKMPGWYSWRHATSEARDKARETYLWNRGRKARQRRADERQAAKEE